MEIGAAVAIVALVLGFCVGYYVRFIVSVASTVDELE